MYVSYDQGAAYLAIPKTASRTISVWLRREYGFKRRYGHHGLCDDRVGQDFFKPYFHFTAVRNPFSRLVSRWFQLCLKYKSKPSRLPLTRENLREVFKPRFKKYIMRLDPQALSRKNLQIYCTTQLSPQSYWIDYAGRFLDKPIHIIKQENLVEELGRLPFVNRKVVLKHIGKHSYGDWRDYYDEESMSKVVEYYWDDFKRFRYETYII